MAGACAYLAGYTVHAGETSVGSPTTILTFASDICKRVTEPNDA
jgi:hypothetical protein